MQGYVVAVDTAIPATTTVSVPITRSIRYDPFEPATSGNPGVPDVQAGLYLRGMRSHSVGFALQRDAVVLMLVDPYASHISAEYGGPTAVGGVLATATISDASIEEGGSGLSFFMRILAGTEGWELRVDAWAGWHVVRPESILRIVSPAL